MRTKNRAAMPSDFTPGKPYCPPLQGLAFRAKSRLLSRNKARHTAASFTKRIMPTKQKVNKERELLELLKRVLPKAVPDPKMAQLIFSAFEKEIQAKARVSAFEEFCHKCELPDLEPKTIETVKKQFEDSFGKGKVAIVPHPPKQAVSVEIVLPNESYEGTIKVKAAGPEDGEEPEFKPKMIPFPVCLPTDPELVWSLGRAETLTPDEACRALVKVQDDFWGSKSGQKLLRDRVERSFPEFVSRVPGKMLSEVGLKRHYKEPEPIKPFKEPKLTKS
jgi:hypothetical protein